MFSAQGPGHVLRLVGQGHGRMTIHTSIANLPSWVSQY